MSLAFPSPGHQLTSPDRGVTHVSARILVAKVMKAETARAEATENGMRNRPSRNGDRPLDFLDSRVVIVFWNCVSVQAGLLNCINCNPVPRGTRNHPEEGSEKVASVQTDSGLQLDLEIA